MRYIKMALWLSLAAGAMALPAAAQDGYWRGSDIRHDRRDLRHDYNRVANLRADIARDERRLNEDIRCGRQGRAAAEAADIARDRRALRAQERDIRHDRRDLNRDYRGY